MITTLAIPREAGNRGHAFASLPLAPPLADRRSFQEGDDAAHLVLSSPRMVVCRPQGAATPVVPWHMGRHNRSASIPFLGSNPINGVRVQTA